jgi:hypothetical protein
MILDHLLFFQKSMFLWIFFSILSQGSFVFCMFPNFYQFFVLTNKPSYCQNITNFNCGLSDVHNLISFQLKGYVPKLKKDFILYRSFKDFLSKKYVFMDFFFNFVTRFLCFLYVSQFLSVFCLRNLLWYIFFL